jgi:glycosyltransferase involved in cell wall biosynthesis
MAYVCADPGIPVFGRKGCSVHVQEVLRALLARGIEVELFASRFGGEPSPDLVNVKTHRLPEIGRGEIADRERAALAANDALRERLMDAGSYDLIYERYSLWSYAGMEYALESGTPGMLEVNAPLIEEQARHRGLADRAQAERMAERVFAAAATLVAVSHEVAEYLLQFPAARGRVHVVGNGVNPDRFPEDLRASLPGDRGAFTVGFVGTLKPWHGLPVLVEAFSRQHHLWTDVRLLIVGDGPEKSALLEDLERRGLLNAAQLTGAVSPDAIPGLLASMDVAVAPYPDLADFYFSPLKVYEYMAAGRAVVASRIGQLADLIQHEVNGLLCPAGDAAALAAALERLRARPELLRRLGSAARETVRRKHTWKAVVQRLLDLSGIDHGTSPARRESAKPGARDLPGATPQPIPVPGHR